MFNDFDNGKLKTRYIQDVGILWETKSEHIPFSSLFEFNSRLLGIKKAFYCPTKESGSLVKEVNKIETTLKKWLEFTPERLCKSYYQTVFRKDLTIQLFQELGFQSSIINGSSYKFIRGYYSLFKYDDLSPYFVLMVKKSHMKYVKLSVLLNEPILEDCFEFWYTPRPAFKGSKAILKEMITELKGIDIPCVLFNSSEELASKLFYNMEIKANSIREQKQYFVNLSNELKKILIDEENGVLHPS